MLLLLIANTINIGADLGAMADAARLVLGGPQVAYVLLFGAVCIVLQISPVHALCLGAEVADARPARLRATMFMAKVRLA